LASTSARQISSKEHVSLDGIKKQPDSVRRDILTLCSGRRCQLATANCEKDAMEIMHWYQRFIYANEPPSDASPIKLGAP